MSDANSSQTAELTKDEILKAIKENIVEAVKSVLAPQTPSIPAEMLENLKKYPSETEAKYVLLLKEAKTADQITNICKLLEAEWSSQYINDLPDSAFAVKDDAGRHLPHHDKAGTIDRDHLIAAIQAIAGARQDQPPPYAAEAKKHLCAHAKELEIESEFCGLTKEAYVVERRKTIVDLKAENANLNTKLAEAQTFRENVKAKIAAIIPPESIVKSHGQTGGFVALVQDMKKLLGEI